MSKINYFVLVFFVIASFVVGGFIAVRYIPHKHSFTQKKFNNTDTPFVQTYLPEIQKLAKEGRYRCCLDIPCSYCLLRSHGSGGGVVCDCLDEVVQGEAPCGECLGEILEGNGNKYLKEYFPQAIADELGDEYLKEINRIIESKYSAKVSLWR